MRWGWFAVAGALMGACTFGNGGNPEPLGMQGTEDGGTSVGDDAPAGPGDDSDPGPGPGTMAAGADDTTTTGPSPVDTGAVDTTTGGTTDGGSAEGSTGRPGDTSGDGPETTGEPDPTTDGTSDTGPTVEPYGPCDQLDPECPEAYPECNLSSQCAPACELASQCPIPETGSPQVICGMNTQQCYLLCSGGSGCPDGMACAQIEAFEFCHWPD